MRNKALKNILEKIEELHEKGKEIRVSHLISHFNDTGTEELLSEAIGISPAIRDKKKILEDCLRHIKKDNMKQTLSNIQFKLKEAEGVSDINNMNRLIVEYNEIIKEFGK